MKKSEASKDSLTKVISGGQSGVDQAALQAALKVGLEIGGWCPPGRESESGKIPDVFPLFETPQECSELAPRVPRSQRTEWNVRDSDATLILKPKLMNEVSDSGLDWTIVAANRYQKRILISDPDRESSEQEIIDWIYMHKVAALNVAGPSEKTVPGVGDKVYTLLIKIFGKLV